MDRPAWLWLSGMIDKVRGRFGRLDPRRYHALLEINALAFQAGCTRFAQYVEARRFLSRCMLVDPLGRGSLLP
jgi:hypothetical protein